LLAKDLFRKTVDKEFPNLISKIKKTDPDDVRLNTALLRDYQILSAAYMLEPCHLSFLKTKNYGIGSDFIPESLAIPMKYLSDRLDC
jgi:indoleamine 2,3-dioxygenase